MMLAFALPPAIAGLQTVTINRNEGQFEEANGVYYCYKGGLMMTFTSGLNNPNYLVEHQQVYFEVRSVNTSYIIKKIVFHCVDNTTNDNLDCFYWGPSTIHIVQNWYNQNDPGTYRYSGYTGTWTGTTNKIQFTTEAKPVRFGSVEITYEKETGDIFDLVTSDRQLQENEKYVIVNQYRSKGLSTEKQASFSQETMDAVDVSFVDNTKTKVIINPEVQIFTLKKSSEQTRPWLLNLTGSNNYLRRHAIIKGTDNYNKGYAIYYESLNSTYSPVSIVIGDASGDTCNARIRFKRDAMVNDYNDTTAISYVNSYTYFRSVAYSSWNPYESSQRVYMYMPARNYEITTECDPTSGGFITLGEGVLELNGQQTSQQYETVSFFVGTREGYGIGTVTATDANNNPITLTCTSQSATGNNYTFTMPSANVHIVATFVDPYVIHTECTPQYGGDYTFNSGAVEMNNTVISNENNNVNFTIKPSLGYVFTGLTCTDDATGDEITLIDNGDGNYSFTMPGNDVTLSASFDRVIGDIFDLVTSGSQIVEGATYIIVSQNHDKVMRHWDKSNSTFQGAPIVEWVTQDKSKVRVDDNACFFRMEDLVVQSNNYRSAYMNTLVGYLGYSGYNGTTGNVVSTPDMSGYNRATMYISAAEGGEKNYLCTFDSIKTANRTIRYENATNTFKIINYNNTTDERVWLYKLAEAYHNISTVCTPPEGGEITAATSAQADEVITFTVTPATGYQVDAVTVTNTDPTITGTITVTDNGDGTYSFTMPDNAVTITANFDVIPDPYAITTECIPSAGGYCHVYVNNVNYYASANAMPNDNVAVWVGTNMGYRIASVTAENLTTGEAVTLTLDPNNSNAAGNTYDFTMPVGNVKITAKFYTPLFLLGTAMGRTSWCPSGPEFDFDPENDQYYLDVYFKGGNVDQNVDQDYGYFSLAGGVAPVDWTNNNETYSNRWGEVSGRLAAVPNNSYNNVVKDGDTGIELSGQNPDNAFKIKAGIYRIIVNRERTQMSIVQYHPEIVFDPESGSPVNLNDIVDITSDLQDIVQNIASRYGINEVAQFEVKTDNVVTWISADHPNADHAEAQITHTGTTEVHAEASIGYIVVEGDAEYTLHGINYVVLPDANAGTVTGPTTSSPDEQVTVTPIPASNYTLVDVTAVTTIDGVVQPIELTPNGDGTYSFDMPDGDVTVTARFGHLINVFWDPDQGGEIIAPAAAMAGDVITFTVSTNAGYALSSLQVLGMQAIEYSHANGSYSFTMPDEDVTIFARFIAGYTVTTVVDPTGSAEIVANNADDPEMTSFPSGTQITVVVTPGGGYLLDDIVVTYGDDEVSLDFTPDGNGNYVAQFDMPYENVTVTAYLSSPLSEIELNGEVDKTYVISDQLMGIFAFDNSLWAKDMGNRSLALTEPYDGEIDYMKTIPEYAPAAGEDWDQSNWVELIFNNSQQASALVNQIFEPASIKGHLTEKLNYKFVVEEGPVVDEQGTYIPNTYGPANFLERNLTLKDGDLGAQSAANGKYYYFLNPKIQEYALVTFALWDRDQQIFVVPEREGFAVNGHNFDGAIRLDGGNEGLDGWQYNMYGDIRQYLDLEENKDNMYQFHILIQRDNFSYGPVDNSNPANSGTTFNSIKPDQTASQNIKAYPLDLKADGTNIVTAVNEVKLSTEVDGIRYYNVMGQESTTPFDGINIMVIRYTDGSMVTKKIYR